MKLTERLTILTDKPTRKLLNRHCKAEGISLGDFTRSAILDALADASLRGIDTPQQAGAP
jgi:hypothetical protein